MAAMACVQHYPGMQQQTLPSLGMQNSRRLPLPRTSKVSLPGVAGSRHAAQRRALTCRQSRQDQPEASPGVSFARLPISQQSLSMAFQILDKDEDGRINRSEAYRLVAYYLALQHHKPAPSQRRPLTWDQHLLSSLATAGKLSGGSWTGVAASCEAYVGVKVSGGLQAHPPRCSDLLWAAMGMAAAVLVLGVLAAAAKTLPVVGHFHQQGVPLLLGSFGTCAILLFGKPEAEPVQLWPILAGQLGATAIAMTVLQAWGANLVSRAAAMAATVAWMMWSDCIHPPGGALVLMAMDNTAIQAMSWSYLLWPSLALTLTVLLPISAATNWLRRNYQFDAPWTHESLSAASMQQKVQEYEQQQAAKQAAVLRQWRALELDRGSSTAAGLQSLHEELHSPLARLARVFRPILQLLSFPQPALQPQQSQQQRRRVITTESGQRFHVRGVNLDLGGLNLGGSISDATPAEQAAAAALEDAIRRKLMQQQERDLEDKLHRRRVWGGYEHNPDLKKVQGEIDSLHQRRQQQQGPDKPKEQPTPSNQQQQGPQHSQKLPEDPSRQHQQKQQEEYGVVSPRRRLEQHWRFKAWLADSSSSAGSAAEGYRSSSPQLKERPQGPSSEGGNKRSSSRQGPTDSFAPDEE